MKPFIKWAGGKGQLLEVLKARMPSSFNTYYEPFIGGAALLLSVAPDNAVLCDTNEQLINVYNQLKSDAEKVIQVVKQIEAAPCHKEYYLSMREKYNDKITSHQLDVECAALMIWLNKHCFNGLYRVNAKGFFNVPYNNNVRANSIDENNLLSIGNYLSSHNVKMECKDFETICRDVNAGDFVYFDSPYVPISETANFTDYTNKGFSLQDHRRLAFLFKNLDSLGAKIMLSNHNVPLVHELYKDYYIECIDVRRNINRNAEKRIGKEVIITNYNTGG